MNQLDKDTLPVQSLLIPQWIIKTGKLLNFISPFLASRFAARIFLTPFSYEMPKRERTMYEKSEKEKVLVPRINREVIVYKYGTSDKKILLAHGWSGSGTQLSKIADQLLANGYSTISFDAPAHGRSPGKWSMMPHFIETIHYLEELYGPFEAAIGHSLGGMSLLRATKDGLSIKKLVIIGTANSVTEIVKDFISNIQLSQKVGKLMKNYFDTKFGEDLDSYSGALSAKQVKVPTLVVHDKDDVDVHYSCAEQIHQSLPDSDLFLTTTLGHRKILGDAQVITKVVNFLTKS
ncbi:alpha/beta fold hydrolase [Aquimarina brevivitae]|uniref:Alpha/beta hydrolase family protein n=1 Tax=Aquimarina brevivitae TaxID=323412 RepID=A0A4Q7P1P4_9FLAO|nr:alpha/beta hydrolase [Aquimarina brevivitae]RZS93776.1 alpha/beta hydrolase family protein [Aquimarina brevivitae]